MVPAPTPIQIQGPIVDFIPSHGPESTRLHNHVLGAYYPSWKIYSGSKPSDMNLKLLTHVYYAFARVKPDGTVHSLDEKADFQLSVDGTHGCLPALVKLKREKHPHLRILLSIGGGSGSAQFPSVAADPVKTRRFAETARKIVQRYHLDGVDIDWEHPLNATQGLGFVNLIIALRSHLPSPTYILTAALPAGEWCLRHIDLARVLVPSQSSSPPLDFLNIMAYDFAGPWTGGQSGHHAQLHAPQTSHNDFAKRSVSRVTQYLISERGLDPKRLVIGIPVYGRSFLGVDGPGQKFSCHAADGDETFEYRSLPRPGAEERVDEEAGAAWCLGEDGGWVSYDTVRTVELKGKYVMEQGLAGLFFWTGSFDSSDDERSLVVAGHRALCNTLNP